MNSLTDLLLSVLAEAGTQCGIDTTRDRKTILSRVEQEGESFLTITLPTIVKDLYQALAGEIVTPDLFRPFKRREGEMLPVFLGGFFRVLFDPYSGELIDAVRGTRQGALVIRNIVQIAGLCGKLFEQANPKRTRDALARYIDNDARVGVNDTKIDEELAKLGVQKRELRVATHALYGEVLREVERKLKHDLLFPHHGPGAVADKLLGNKKWLQPSWPERLEEVFPFGKWTFSSWLNYLDEVDAGRVADPGAEIPVKVITVPKTQKTPRIIAVEPTYMQYMQQAVRGVLEVALSHDLMANAMVGYSSQEPNQLLARKGSLDGSLATLDLSDASDLVSNDLVSYLFHDWPAFSLALQSTRSQYAAVNLGDKTELVKLHKFASMGSALCFPIEAMVFSIITLVGIRRELGSHTSLADVVRLTAGSVRVYGDDIIVPSDYALSVVACLEASGLKVNRNKSFWSGNFRESCGKEYWYGHDVTYAKVRYRLPSLQKALSDDVEATVHTVALRNNLYWLSRFDTVNDLDALLEKRLNGVYPRVYPTSAALGRHDSTGYDIHRTDNNLQKPMVKAYVVNVKSPRSYLDGYGALMKCLVTMSGLPNPDPEHLLRAGRPSALRIKQRWTSPV